MAADPKETSARESQVSKVAERTKSSYLADRKTGRPYTDASYAVDALKQTVADRMRSQAKESSSDGAETRGSAPQYRNDPPGVRGSFASGGTVPETGLYKMHAGEKVIPAAGKSSGGSTGGGHGKHTGAAEHMMGGGSDESGVEHQNSPFRALHEGGHAANHSYKNPVASILGEANAVNHSYMHPLDMGSGAPKPEVPPKVWGKANSVKPMSKQGAGKMGGTLT